MLGILGLLVNMIFIIVCLIVIVVLLTGCAAVLSLVIGKGKLWDRLADLMKNFI